VSRTFLRRLVTASAAALVVGVVGAGSAFASSTLPANNATDHAGRQSTQVYHHTFAVKINGSKFEGAAFSSKVATNPGAGDFAATIAVAKAVMNDHILTQKITIKPNCGTTVKCRVVSAHATLSGGTVGSGVITSTTLAKNGTSYIVNMSFDQQATNPNLNIKFHLQRP
jgi:hypothetical protein